MKVVSLTVCVFLSLIFYGQIPVEGLQAYYTFNNNTSDSSGLANNATAAGCSFSPDRFGNNNSSLRFNGLFDSLVMPIAGLTPLTGEFAISFWVKTNSPEAMNIFSLKEFPNDTTDNFEVQFNSITSLQTILELYYGSYTYWNGSGNTGNALGENNSGKYYNGKWQHYVVQRRSDTLEFWHDRGLAYSSTPGYIYSGTMGDALDFVVSAAPHRFEGDIDDIAFYNRSLTVSEIMEIYHIGKPFEFKSPLPTDAYVQGDTLSVMWWYNSLAVSDSVDLEYKINDGPWQMTTQNQLVDWTPFHFPLNYPIGTTIEMRITDRSNPNNTSTTGTFRISEYKWQNVSQDLPFTNRDGSGLLNYNGKMWLLGGWDPPYHDPTYTHSEVWSTTDGLNWTFETTAPWPGRHCSGWLVHDNAMWVVGGDPQSGALRDVWKSTDGINWTQILDTIPEFSPLRTMHMMASINGNMFNFGGQQIEYVNENLNQIWRSTNGLDWTQLPDAPWKPRGMMLNSCVDNQDTLWLLGGGRLNDRRCYNDVWKTGDGTNWELVLATAPWQSRYWHNVAWYDNKMWVICGIVNQTDNNETWYSSNGIDWYELKQPKYSARHAASVTVYDNALWLMAGIASDNCWKLTNQSPTWVDDSEKSEESIIIYPNPNNGRFQVIAPNKFLFYEVFGSTGNFIQSGNIHSTENNPMEELKIAPGIYFVIFTGEQGQKITKKLIVQ